MNKLLLIDIVGLTPSMIGPNTPHLKSLAEEGSMTPMAGAFPAVTCSAQSTMLTGAPPRDHGIVANGWMFRDLAEVWLWRQSNHLVGGEKLWDTARRHDARFTACNMFWWYNMHASVDYSLTPRPLYFADGRKAPGIYGRPLDFRRNIESKLPTFPLFQFWGPAAGIASTDWITDASILAMQEVDSTLTLVYLPHLDYDLQRFGPNHPKIAEEVRAVDACVGRLLDHARRSNRKVLVVSEYGITEVTGAVHINRVLRRAGLLEVTPMLDRELPDPGASAAFAVADHQVAHVYVKDADRLDEVRTLLENTSGIDRVLDRREQAELGVDHERSGELVAISDRDRWFTYYHWLDDDRAPDYARTVDIHSKPGYDPVELFLDPKKSAVKARIVWKLLRKKLGFRTLMDVISLDADLVSGSHGRLEDDPNEGPILMSSETLPGDRSWAMTDVKDLALTMMFGAGAAS